MARVLAMQVSLAPRANHSAQWGVLATVIVSAASASATQVLVGWGVRKPIVAAAMDHALRHLGVASVMMAGVVTNARSSSLVRTNSVLGTVSVQAEGANARLVSAAPRAKCRWCPTLQPP